MVVMVVGYILSNCPPDLNCLLRSLPAQGDQGYLSSPPAAHITHHHTYITSIQYLQYI